MSKVKTTKKFRAQFFDLAVKTLGPAKANALAIRDADTALVAALAVLDTAAAERLTEAAKAANARVPLIDPRYASTLARGIAAALDTRGDGPAFTWLSVTRQTIHNVYMTGETPRMERHDKHPGSRAGFITVDCRRLDDFADTKGAITSASVEARVRGQVKP